MLVVYFLFLHCILFTKHASLTATTCFLVLLKVARLKYKGLFKISLFVANLGDYRGPLPGTFERDGRSRYRVLKCAHSHLSDLYAEDRDPKKWRYNAHLCHCPITAVIGNKCRWRKIPVRIWHSPEEGPAQFVSNLR